MIKIPAHKNIIDPPGQMVNPIPEQTLGQYIARKQKETPKKLSFDEWAEDSQIIYRSVETKEDLAFYLKECWKAAQDNK